MTREELLQFEGVSRTVLEARVRALVDVLDAAETQLVRRLAGRVSSAIRLSSTYPDAAVQEQARVRMLAYRVAMDDVHELFADALDGYAESQR